MPKTQYTRKQLEYCRLLLSDIIELKNKNASVEEIKTWFDRTEEYLKQISS